MRKIKMIITADLKTAEPICIVVIANPNRTVTRLTVSKDTQDKYFQFGKVQQTLQFVNQVLKDNSLIPMIQEEVDFFKNHDLMGDFIKKEFTIEDLQKVSGVK